MDSERRDKPWSKLDLDELDAGWDTAERAPVLAEPVTHVRLVTRNNSKGLRRPARKFHWALVSVLVLPLAGVSGWSVARLATRHRVVEASIRASLTDAPSATTAATATPASMPGPTPVMPNSGDSRDEQSPNTRRVLVEIDPAGAQIFSGGELIGTDLVNVELADGAPKELSIQLNGYVTHALVVDGSRDFVHVDLVPALRAQRRQRAARPRVVAPQAEHLAASGEADLAYP